MKAKEKTTAEEKEFNFEETPEEKAEGATAPSPSAEEQLESPSQEPAAESTAPRNETTTVADARIKDSPEFVEATKDIVPETPEERRLSRKQLLTKRFFDAQKRVPIFIPLEKGEVKGTLAYFATNGYKFYVPKGLVVEVPEDIAKRYYASIGAESEALSEHKFNLANASEEKISRLTR